MDCFKWNEFQSRRKEFFMHMWNLNKFVSSLVGKKILPSLHNRLEAKKKVATWQPLCVFKSPGCDRNLYFLLQRKKKKLKYPGEEKNEWRKKAKELWLWNFFFLIHFPLPESFPPLIWFLALEMEKFFFSTFLEH